MAVLHIGPSKTASTSIQAIIPLLGRPYLIKPEWAKLVGQGPLSSKSKRLDVPPEAIISCEQWGDCEIRPRILAARFHVLFGPCTAVLVHRDAEDRLASFYRFTHGKPWAHQYESLEAFKAHHQELYTRSKRGLYATADLDLMRATYAELGHELKVVDFNLLRTAPRSFLEAFCRACGANHVPEINIPHLNAN